MGLQLRRRPSFSPKHDAYSYQLDALTAVKSLPYAAIFHEQGLGKTKIAVDLVLSWLSHDVVDTVFIVTKKTLVTNWVHELAAHSWITPSVLSDDRRRNGASLNSPVLVYVMNYEVVPANAELIRDFLRTCRVAAVLDESQKIKNPDTHLARCFHSLASGFERRIIMTGTPSANRPYDIWSQVKFLDDGLALGDSYDAFRDEHDLPMGTTTSEVREYGQRLAGIMERIRGFSVRETKGTAGIHLPTKTILTHLVDLAPRQATMYRSYRDRLAWELRDELENSMLDDAEAILKRLLRLVQCASNPGLVDRGYTECPGKFPKLSELLDAATAAAEKLVVWTRFVDNVEWLAARLVKHAPQKVHGSMTIADRNAAIAVFRTNADCRTLIATPGAAKEGLTLTVANHAVFYDRGFSLDDYLQAQDRIHRISQEKECFVHNLMASDTIDEWVDDLLNAKHRAAQMAQGDIKPDEFRETFDGGFRESLMAILTGREKEWPEAVDLWP